MSTSDLDEAKAVAEVVDRLAAQFPNVQRSHIDEIVQSEHHALDGKPIREFVPVLVEHATKARLRDELANA